MPISEKKKLETAMSSQLMRDVLVRELEDSDSSDTSVDSLHDLLSGLRSTRYMAPRQNIPRSTAHRFVLFEFTPSEFRQAVRVDRGTFDFIHDLIKGDTIFHSRSGRPQLPVVVQLSVTLERCGAFGNGISCGRLSRHYGIGAGTVSTCVERVRRALLRHYSRFVSWPTRQQRQVSSAFHRERFGLDGAVAFVDGTYVNFSQRPHIDGSIHFTRKKRYGFNVQVVYNEDQHILFIYTGWPGSCADSSVYSKSPLWLHPSRYLSDGEFLVGDSGYALTDRLITPYKLPAAAAAENAQFNTILSSARVVNENCIGALKNRWSSLYGVRTPICQRGDFRKVNHHILVCAMMHNIALEANDAWMVCDVASDEESSNTDFVTPSAPSTQQGVEKREHLKQRMLG